MKQTIINEVSKYFIKKNKNKKWEAGKDFVNYAVHILMKKNTSL